MKKNTPKSLDPEQRTILSKVHTAQIVLEISFVVFILSLFTINISSVVPGYGVFDLTVMLASGLTVFIAGIAVTTGVMSMKYVAKPLSKRYRTPKRWLIATWLCLPLVFTLFLLSATSTDSNITILMLSLAFIAAVCMIATIIGSLISTHMLWRRFHKNRRSPVRIVSYSVVVIFMLGLTLIGSYTTTEVIKHESLSVSDAGLELGQTEIRQIGKDGEKQTRHNLIFGFPVSSTTVEPINEHVAKGSKRYQYMYCSNGTYYYFTAEQFKDPNTGFTHQSPDQCAQNGSGSQTTLADVPPAEKVIQQVPTYRAPSYTTCTESYFGGSITCRTY